MTDEQNRLCICGHQAGVHKWCNLIRGRTRCYSCDVCKDFEEAEKK